MQTLNHGNKGGAGLLILVLGVTMCTFFISIRCCKSAEIMKWKKKTKVWKEENELLNRSELDNVLNGTVVFGVSES